MKLISISIEEIFNMGLAGDNDYARIRVGKLRELKSDLDYARQMELTQRRRADELEKQLQCKLDIKG